VAAIVAAAAAAATVTAVVAMVTAMAGVVALAAKATALSFSVPPQQCAANTAISLKRDARKRCQQQRQATGNNQPAGQRDERVAQHERQRNDSNGDDDNGDGDSGDNNDNDHYAGSGEQHCWWAPVLVGGHRFCQRDVFFWNRNGGGKFVVICGIF
jgi:hypothetical protein